jgi:hypothetical protein
MDAAKMELASFKQTSETLVNQKKDYIKKLFNELNEAKGTIKFKINQEQMIAEDIHSKAAALYH